MAASLHILQKSKRKKSLLLRLACLIVFAYILVVFVNQEVTISQKRAQYEQLQQQITAQQTENETMKSLTTEENREEYIEKIARETLNYVYPGEKVYVNIAGE